MVEMVLDHMLAATRNEDELLNTGFAGFFDCILNHGLVHHRQHFLRDSLGGRKEAGSHARNGKNSFADRLCDRHVDAFQKGLFHDMGPLLMSSFPGLVDQASGEGEMKQPRSFLVAWMIGAVFLAVALIVV